MYPQNKTASGKWEVEVWPSNRNCHNPQIKYSTKIEEINGVKVRRVWRPAWRQHSNLGRILSSVWMMKLWCLRFLFSPGGRPDILVIGTDPIFCLGIAPFLKLVHPQMKVVHWCFDLYPEYAIANGMAKENGLIAKMLRWFMGKGYAHCDLVADIGPCMREKLERYPAKARTTHTPWSFEEPAKPLPLDLAERRELFGQAQIALLYSGNFGLPHEFYMTLKLARAAKADGLVLCYSVHGSRVEALQKAANPEDINVRFAAFAPAGRLAARLACPDIHVVSLRSPWTGLLVPSKFFGALAVGRPVLFEGDDAEPIGDTSASSGIRARHNQSSPFGVRASGQVTSSIARWIREYGVGWVLNHDNLEEVRTELLRFSGNTKKKDEMFKRCHSVYQEHFSKKAVLDDWDAKLQRLSS